MKRYLFSISAFRLKKMNAFLVLKTMILPLYFKCTYILFSLKYFLVHFRFKIDVCRIQTTTKNAIRIACIPMTRLCNMKNTFKNMIDIILK